MKSKERKQMDLNKKLIEACLQDNVNFDEVKLLLKQGADPIGYYGENGLNVLRQIIGVRGTFDKEDNTTVYDLIKLFRSSTPTSTSTPGPSTPMSTASAT